MRTASQEPRKGGTLAEMRERCLNWTEDSQGCRKVAGSAYNRILLRPVSLRITWLLVRLGVRADSVTVAMILAGLAGLVFCVPHRAWATLIAALAFILFDVLDAVDGEVARWNESSSTRGLLLDKVAHLLIQYPSVGLPGLHYYAMHGDDRYLVLAMVAIVTGLMGCAVREILLRINAETGRHVVQPEPPAVRPGRSVARLFLAICGRLTRTPLATFPIAKARIVHLLSIGAIVAAYRATETPLIVLAWSYAAYCGLSLILKIPYYYLVRVVNVAHVKQVDEYPWPI